MNTPKEARRDAREYARAEMFYGEGAGTRRKLIQATVDSKSHRDPAYARAFHAELERQDMAEHAAKARAERARKDRNEVVSRNARGLLTGNSRNVNTSVLIVAGVIVIAHKTGLDAKLYYKGKAYVQNVRARHARKRDVHVVHNVTNLR